MPSALRGVERLSAMILVTLVVFTAGCRAAPPATASGEGGWLKGTPDEKFGTVAKQLRGFDMAMVETAYRYNQLYWAGQDANWAYADYQIKKIRTAVENGLERRPKRAASAQTFLSLVLPALEDAIGRRSPESFRERFATLTSTCNACHQAEQVGFIQVDEPRIRLSAVQQ